MRSNRRNPPYFETPDDTREEMIGPIDGITDGQRQIEYWRDCGNVS